MKEKLSNKDKAIKAGIKDPAVVKRFKSKLMTQPNGCIEFNSARWDKRDMYRRFGITWYIEDTPVHESVKAHRFAWALEKGFDALPIAGKFSGDSKIINHICGNKRCVNVDHLNVLTSRENLLPENHGKK
jgi:HNH endonuclease